LRKEKTPAANNDNDDDDNADAGKFTDYYPD
jgi:hypothetical protein